MRTFARMSLDGGPDGEIGFHRQIRVAFGPAGSGIFGPVSGYSTSQQILREELGHMGFLDKLLGREKKAEDQATDAAKDAEAAAKDAAGDAEAAATTPTPPAASTPPPASSTAPGSGTMEGGDTGSGGAA
jgi:hypothetical protein